MSCATGKIRYRDRVDALIALSDLSLTEKRRRKSGREESQQRAYRCKLCRGWHLTSQDFRPPLSALDTRAEAPPGLERTA